MEKTVSECLRALETAYRVLEVANEDRVPAAQWLLYQGRVADARANLEKARSSAGE
jgi:phosphohistidine phosphatase SixA